MNDSIPTDGLLIRSSYEYYNKKGYYAVMDLSTNKLAFPVEYFNEVQASDNAICLLAIYRAVRFCIENSLSLKVYVANKISLGWAHNARFKSKESEASIHRLVHTNASIVLDNDYRDKILIWQPWWGSPKDWMHHLIY
jgi:hypothetical protein